MEFRVEESNGRPNAIFEDEKLPRNWLLSAFLEQSRTEAGMKRVWKEIKKAEQGEKQAGLTGDHVDVEVHPDRIVIEELWPPGGEDAEPAKTEIDLSQAKQLLKDWKEAIDNWYAQRS